MKSVLMCLLALLVAGCASLGGADLVPGASTAAQVEVSMGPPAEKISLQNGEMVWFYPQQPYGRVSYAVVLGSDGIVRSVEQRLTEKSMQRIVPDSSTMQEVRALLGPPTAVVRYPGRDGDSWEYNMLGGPINDWKILSVRFDQAGLVKDVSFVDDPDSPRLSRRRGFWLLFGF